MRYSPLDSRSKLTADAILGEDHDERVDSYDAEARPAYQRLTNLPQRFYGCDRIQPVHQRSDADRAPLHDAGLRPRAVEPER